MIALLLQMWRLMRALARVMAEPEGRALGILVSAQLLTGTVFYTLVEGWRWLDSLYFCVTSLSTVGFGDPAPQTDAGKLFTMVFILTGVGLLASFISLLAHGPFAGGPAPATAPEPGATAWPAPSPRGSSEQPPPPPAPRPDAPPPPPPQ